MWSSRCFAILIAGKKVFHFSIKVKWIAIFWHGVFIDHFHKHTSISGLNEKTSETKKIKSKYTFSSTETTRQTMLQSNLSRCHLFMGFKWETVIFPQQIVNTLIFIFLYMTLIKTALVYATRTSGSHKFRPEAGKKKTTLALCQCSRQPNTTSKTLCCLLAFTKLLLE